MQRLEVSGAVRLIYRSLGVKGLSCEVWRWAIELLLAAAFSTKWQYLQRSCFCYSSRDVFCLHTYK